MRSESVSGGGERREREERERRQFIDIDLPNSQLKIRLTLAMDVVIIIFWAAVLLAPVWVAGLLFAPQGPLAVGWLAQLKPAARTQPSERGQGAQVSCLTQRRRTLPQGAR